MGLRVFGVVIVVDSQLCGVSSVIKEYILVNKYIFFGVMASNLYDDWQGKTVSSCKSYFGPK